MGTRTIIPFGPQHPVLPEPIHLDLVLEDETVVQALPSVGFVHRGLERLCEKIEYQEMAFVAERICGICSFIHAEGYCQAVEALMKIEVPARARYLRTFWGELSRIHSHLLWLGLGADAFGYESLFQHTWRVRERIVDIIEKTAGGRVIFGSCKVGGVRRDVEDGVLKALDAELREIEDLARQITGIFLSDATVRNRLEGVGMLSKADARDLGAAGPVLRASGVSEDMRKLGYAAYGELSIEPVVETGCDCLARAVVRAREVHQSFDLLRQVIARMPSGPVEVQVRGFPPEGEHLERLEQPRGEVVYYIKGSGKKHLERFRVRTPTFANIAPLVAMLKGADLADVPNIVLTIDPCISCTER